MLKGKYAIITGARRGIGRATVRLFAENGATIFACIRKEDPDFEAEMAAWSEETGVKITPVHFELRDHEARKQGVRRILSASKAIDVLVNCAGIADGGPLTMTSMDRLQEVFEINYFAPVEIMQLVARKMMRQKSGSIINVASVAGLEAQPGYLTYGSSKAALIWATRSISKELGQYGIRVNAIAPGMTKTDMGGSYKTSEELQNIIHRTALRRMGTPEEIAQAMLFLASDRSSFVSGEILQVDGGRI